MIQSVHVCICVFLPFSLHLFPPPHFLPGDEFQLRLAEG